jgi:serine/threonine protein kinase
MFGNSFGAKPAFGQAGGGAFGGGASSGGAFGAKPAFGQAGGGAFGGASSGGAFGAKPAAGGFGGFAGAAPATGGFGAAASGGFGFGRPAAGAFGGCGGAFGQPAAAGGFGATRFAFSGLRAAPAAGAGGGAATPAFSESAGAGGVVNSFGQNVVCPGSNKGMCATTEVLDEGIGRPVRANFCTISANKQLARFSHEEIRMADYSAGKYGKYNKLTAGVPTAGAFGGNAGAASPGRNPKPTMRGPIARFEDFWGGQGDAASNLQISSPSPMGPQKASHTEGVSSSGGVDSVQVTPGKSWESVKASQAPTQDAWRCNVCLVNNPAFTECGAPVAACAACEMLKRGCVALGEDQDYPLPVAPFKSLSQIADKVECVQAAQERLHDVQSRLKVYCANMSAALSGPLSSPQHGMAAGTSTSLQQERDDKRDSFISAANALRSTLASSGLESWASSSDCHALETLDQLCSYVVDISFALRTSHSRSIWSDTMDEENLEQLRSLYSACGGWWEVYQQQQSLEEPGTIFPQLNLRKELDIAYLRCKVFGCRRSVICASLSSRFSFTVGSLKHGVNDDLFWRPKVHDNVPFNAIGSGAGSKTPELSVDLSCLSMSTFKCKGQTHPAPVARADRIILHRLEDAAQSCSPAPASADHAKLQALKNRKIRREACSKNAATHTDKAACCCFVCLCVKLSALVKSRYTDGLSKFYGLSNVPSIAIGCSLAALGVLRQIRAMMCNDSVIQPVKDAIATLCTICEACSTCESVQHEVSEPAPATSPDVFVFKAPSASTTDVEHPLLTLATELSEELTAMLVSRCAHDAVVQQATDEAATGAKEILSQHLSGLDMDAHVSMPDLREAEDILLKLDRCVECEAQHYLNLRHDLERLGPTVLRLAKSVGKMRSRAIYLTTRAAVFIEEASMLKAAGVTPSTDKLDKLKLEQKKARKMINRATFDISEATEDEDEEAKATALAQRKEARRDLAQIEQQLHAERAWMARLARDFFPEMQMSFPSIAAEISADSEHSTWIEGRTKQHYDELVQLPGGRHQCWTAKHGGEMVVLKEFSMCRPVDRDMFKREFKFQDTLSHPRLLRVQASFGDQENVYLQYPYISGGNMRQWLIKHKPNESVVSRVCFEVMVGLSYMHNKDIPVLHCDLKQENVLIDSHQLPLIADFETCKELRQDTTTLSHMHGGTHGYVAPELANGTGRPSRAADIFAFGVLWLNALIVPPAASAASAVHPPYPITLQNIKQAGVFSFGIKVCSASADVKAKLPLLRRILDPDARKRPTATQLLLAPELNIQCAGLDGSASRYQVRPYHTYHTEIEYLSA